MFSMLCEAASPSLAVTLRAELQAVLLLRTMNLCLGRIGLLRNIGMVLTAGLEVLRSTRCSMLLTERGVAWPTMTLSVLPVLRR